MEWLVGLPAGGIVGGARISRGQEQVDVVPDAGCVGWVWFWCRLFGCAPGVCPTLWTSSGGTSLRPAGIKVVGDITVVSTVVGARSASR